MEQKDSNMRNEIEINSENSKNLNIQFTNWKYKYKCIQETITEIKVREENVSNLGMLKFFVVILKYDPF